MSGEGDFIALMRGLASHPAARGLMDDAAVLDLDGRSLVLTHDMIVEGVHYRPNDPAGDVAWKLVAINMSDLAAKGALPLGVLLGFSLTGASEWEREFATGLGEALAGFSVPLLGGDTVAMPPGAPRALGLTAIGSAPVGGVPSRAGAKPGDLIYVSGTIGDAGAGLSMLERGHSDLETDEALIAAYRRPAPNLALGRALAPFVSAMADISDGLLIDAARIAKASGSTVHIDLDRVPLSAAFVARCGDSRESRLSAVTAGDDYRLLFSADPSRTADIAGAAARCGVTLTAVGRCAAGEGLTLFDAGQKLPLPARLGYEHRGDLA